MRSSFVPWRGAAPRRRFAASLLAACAVAVPGVAGAHARLVSSEPPNGATLAEAPAAITLRFDSRVERRFARLRLSGPDGKATLSAGSGEAVKVLVVRLPTLAAGDHALGYDVVSADGHRIDGTIRFTVEK